MDQSLWDVATIQLEQALSQPGIQADEQAKILLLLAENLIRGNDSKKALEILESSMVNQLPGVRFWKGQALAGMGRFADAVESLKEVAAEPTNPFAKEAAFTAASLQLSLATPKQALSTLKLLENAPKEADRIAAIVQRIEILIDMDDFENARALMPKQTQIPLGLKSTIDFLEARILLAEGKPAEAGAIFNDLVANPEGQTSTRHSHAVIGQADSLAARDNKAEAMELLLAFIQERPSTPMLEPIFRRVIEWLPTEIITAAHPTLVRLEEWTPQIPPRYDGLVNTGPGTAQAVWPIASTEIKDLGIFALHAKAIGLHRIDSIIAKQQAQRLLQRILLLAPSHFLAQNALLTLAKWHLEAGERDHAFALFDSLQQTATSPLIKGEAIFYDAKIAFEAGDQELAAKLFNQAAELLRGKNRENALLNSALATLNEGESGAILITTEDPETAAKLNTELTLERALAKRDPKEAKAALDSFLTSNPDHPRTAEARLAIIEAALATSPPDLSLAQAQLDTIEAQENPLPAKQISRLALAELRILDEQEKTEETVAMAEEIIKRFPGTKAESDASLIMGKSLFRSGNYNQARLILEKLSNSQPGTQLSQASLLLAARSAALGATVQSREEALALFDQTIAIDGPLRSLAILEKARLNIDLNRIDTAIESLTSAYDATSPQDPSRLPTGLLLGEAVYARGDSNPESLQKSLEIYNDLISLSVNNPAQFFRLQYLRGLTLEKVPDPDAPTQTRLKDALAAYFSVLDRSVEPAPPEWEWFERSGFRALTLLENAKRWQAAISIAEKIASFGGPRAEEASTRARDLRLKHMIWEN